MNNSSFYPLEGSKKKQPILRPPRFSVQLILFNQPFSPLNPGFMKNLSSRGAFIEAFPEQAGEAIDLEFAFPGQKRTYRVAARIVWAKKPYEESKVPDAPSGIGVTFLSFTQGSEEELLYDLIYWGELMKANGPQPETMINSTQYPGCLGRPENSEMVPYLSTVDDRDIDTALDSFMKSIIH